MKILNRKFSANHFINYIEDLDVKRKIDKLVFHHTSSPEDTWHGSASMLHYYNLYKSRGWKTGPHIFIAPDGIWLFSSIKKQGTHAGRQGNKNSIGIEIVGRYFEKEPTNKQIKYYTSVVTVLLMGKFGLTWEQVYTHKDFEQDNFCAESINRQWLYNNVIEHK